MSISNIGTFEYDPRETFRRVRQHPLDPITVVGVYPDTGEPVASIVVRDLDGVPNAIDALQEQGLAASCPIASVEHTPGEGVRLIGSAWCWVVLEWSDRADGKPLVDAAMDVIDACYYIMERKGSLVFHEHGAILLERIDYTEDLALVRRLNRRKIRRAKKKANALWTVVDEPHPGYMITLTRGGAA